MNASFAVSKRSACGNRSLPVSRKPTVQLTDGCGGITRGDHIKRCGNGALVNIGRNNAH